MSDDRLRELERRWRASGALDDEVALVHERLRAGALDEARVRLAAGLGVPAAAAVARAPTTLLDELVRRHEFTFEGQRSWRWNAVTGCDARWGAGPAALRRLAASAARVGLRAWTTFASEQPALRDVLERPARELRRLVDAVVGRAIVDDVVVNDVMANLGALEDLDGLTVDDAVFDALNAVSQLALLLSTTPGNANGDPDDLLAALVDLDAPARDPGGWCVALAMNATSREEVEVGLRRDVGDWALGHGDPLRGWATG